MTAIGPEHEQDLVPASLVGDHCVAPWHLALEGMRSDQRDVDISRNPTVAPASMTGGLHRKNVDTMRAQVEETIEVIRPALQADGGDIVLRDVDEETGVVSVTLVGACGTCPASTRR